MNRAAHNDNMPPHSYFGATDFRHPMFLKVRRQVALLRLPYAEGKMRELLVESVRIYADLLADR